MDSRRKRVGMTECGGKPVSRRFRSKSDIDLLVTFAPESSWRLDHILEMKEEMEKLLGRRVDLVEKRLIESSPNYIRRKHILNNLETFMWRDDAWLLDMCNPREKL